jgi:hypothetical protein
MPGSDNGCPDIPLPALPTVSLASIRQVCALVLVCSLMPGQVQADVGSIRWNGFLNVVGGQVVHEPVGIDNVAADSPESIEGYQNHFSLDQDTSAGLQATQSLSPSDSITVQLFAKGREGYNAEMKWLYYAHEFDNGSTLRAGRIGAPAYYYSDFFNVGYTYHWITPPGEVYSYDTTVTGLDYIYRDAQGQWDWSTELLYGSNEQHLPLANATLKSEDLWAVIGTATWQGWLSVRAATSGQRATFTFDRLSTDSLLDDGFRALTANGFPQAQIDALRPSLEPLMRPLLDDATLIEDSPFRYDALALRAEQGPWLGMAERVRYTTETYVYSKIDAWYLSGAWRHGAWQYHLTRTYYKQPLMPEARLDYAVSQQSPPLGSLTAFADYFARTIRFNPANYVAKQRDGWSAGLNRDVGDNAVLKLEITWFETTATVPGESAGIGENLMLRTGVHVTF